MKIDQIYIAPNLEEYFGKNFREKWNLKKYHDPTSPSFFLGLFSNDDFRIFNEHAALSVFLPAGGEILRDKDLIITTLKSKKENHIVSYGKIADFFKKNNIFCHELNISVKSYDTFIPTALGSKIYYYLGVNGNRHSELGYDKVIKPLIDELGEELFISTQNIPIGTLHDNFYKNCFLYIQPQPSAGLTTMFELGHMGIMTASNFSNTLPNVINYESLEDLKKIIENEKNKIGTIQEELSQKVKNSFFQKNDWLDTDYYLKIINLRQSKFKSDFLE
jgi:hypothetical protein